MSISISLILFGSDKVLKYLMLSLSRSYVLIIEIPRLIVVVINFINFKFLFYEKICSLRSSSSSLTPSSSWSRWLHVLMRCYHIIKLKSGDLVPCGKCPACLANQRQEWVFRLKQEYLDSKFSVFVTLTYDDDHLPDGSNVSKRDVQLFHKRLRKHFPSQDLRYYLVSEYGDHTFRPHYHGLYFFKSDYDRNKIYDIFSESWSKGFIKFGEVEEGSIVYCTKYCLKHSTTPLGRKDTFRLVSKMNGGLGSNYLQKMSRYHEETQNFAFVSYGGKSCRMPRYYRSKMLVLKDKQQAFEEMYDMLYEEHYERFKLFKEKHKFNSEEDLNSVFLDHEKKSHDVRDQLIIKHTQKQKF